MSYELIDIIIAVLLVLGTLVYLKKFPVFRVILGTLFLLLSTSIFYFAKFYYTAWVFGIASIIVVVSLPLVFSPEIRHYLEKLGRFSFLRLPRLRETGKKSAFVRDLVDSVFELAERKIGASIVIERKTGLGQTLETGIPLDARFSSKLLQSIFFPNNPLHDGAVIIKDGRILAAGSLLPIHADVELGSLGTRHKSGLSITQDTDAISIIVSEERGEVSLAENGKLDLGLDKIKLTEKLNILVV